MEPFMIHLFLGNPRIRLFVLVLILLIPALGLIYYTTAREWDLQKARAKGGALNLIKAAAANHERLIESTKQVLVALSHLPEVQLVDSGACSSLFRTLQREYPFYAMGVSDTDGNIFCSSLPLKNPVNIKGEPYFRKAVEERRFTVSARVVGPMSGKPTIIAAYPAKDPRGNIKAVLIAALDLDWFNKLAASEGLPAGSVFTITDAHGTVLARYPDPDKRYGTDLLDEAVIKVALGKQEGVVELPGLDGVQRLYAFRQLSGASAAGLHVSVGIPVSAAYEGAAEAIPPGLLAVAALLAAFGAWFAGDVLIIRRIKRLQSTAKSLASGDMSARIGVASKQKDIGELMLAFDEMAEVLQKRDEQLRISEAKYRLLVEQIPATTYTAVMDQQSTTNYVSPHIESLLGYTQSEWVYDKELWLKCICDEDRARIEEALAATRVTGKPLACEYRLTAKSGATVWVRDEAVVVRDDGKGPPYLHGIMIDITERKNFVQSLERLNLSLRKSVDGTIRAMSFTVQSKDPYTAGHEDRVSKIACAIAEGMGLQPERVEGIRVAGLIHDIGKIAVPAEILSKPGKISANEFALIKDHSQTGFDILKSIEFPWPIAQTVLQHHERMDGSGYPGNLKGVEIILEARIIAVADVVEAMSCHRPYRPALGIPAALEEIRAKKDTAYDPSVVDACLSLAAKGQLEPLLSRPN
jgi:PAS domain S-box-containing protein/putative nucleotidyltransferase with HDIG domain